MSTPKFHHWRDGTRMIGSRRLALATKVIEISLGYMETISQKTKQGHTPKFGYGMQSATLQTEVPSIKVLVRRTALQK